MGKKQAFRDILHYLQKNWCPKAFALRPPYSTQQLWTAMHDDTGRLYRMPKQELTGQEMYGIWKRLIVETLGQGLESRHNRLVLVCDDQDRVPNRKRREWAKRKESRMKSQLKEAKADGAEPAPPPRHVKYLPEKCSFTAGGLVFHETGTIETIDMRTLRASGAMRKDMYKYFMWMVENDFDLRQSMAPDATFILDFHGEGPCLFQPCRGWVRLSHLRHPFGEADKALVFWAIVFRSSPTTITSNDRDMIPILFHYCMCEGFSRNGSPLWWIYEPRARHITAGEAGCLHVMEMTIKLAERWTTSLFLLASCLCGTDYVEKSQCTNNAGQDVIFACVQRNKDVANGVKALFSLEAIEEAKREEKFDLVVKMQKHNQSSIQCWNQLLNNIKACSRAPKAKDIQMADRLEALDDILFNVGYWGETWSKFNGATEWPA